MSSIDSQTNLTYPVFSLGFRPFFGLAGLAAILLMVIWSAVLKGHTLSANYFPPVYWHAHEMLVGYTTAVIAGFLLTAVRNWTNLPTAGGNKLAGLCLLWLYGRIVPFYEGQLPDIVIALIDLAFLPVLTVFIAKPILAGKQYQNLIFPGLLLILFLGNLMIHAGRLGVLGDLTRSGLHLIVATIVLLILMIAGRIFPFFTERGLPGTICIRNSKIDLAAICSAALVFGLNGIGLSGFLLAIAALLAAVLNIVRLANWYTPKIWYAPLLWILYTGYGWVILGFFLTFFSAFGLLQPSLVVHAFTMGGIGVLTLGMMARVALGHTGRKLQASWGMTIAFLVINMATMLRVILPIIMPVWMDGLLTISILAWLVAFCFFVVEYGPILTSARIDGKD